MRATTIKLTAALVLLIAAPAIASNAKDEEAIKAAAAAFGDAWNKADVKAFAQTFTEDGTLASPAGDVVTGRAALEARLTAVLAGPFKGTTHELTLTTIHFVRPDVAFVDGDVVLSGVKSPDGKTMPPMQARTMGVLVKTKGKWLFSELRGYVYMQPPPGAHASAAPAH